MHLHAPKANLTCKCRPYVYANNQPPGLQSAIVVSSARSLYYVALPLMVSARLPPFLNQIAPFEFQRIAVFFGGGGWHSKVPGLFYEALLPSCIFSAVQSMVITLGVRCRDGVEHAHLQRSSAVPQKMYQEYLS